MKWRIGIVMFDTDLECHTFLGWHTIDGKEVWKGEMKEASELCKDLQRVARGAIYYLTSDGT